MKTHSLIFRNINLSCVQIEWRTEIFQMRLICCLENLYSKPWIFILVWIPNSTRKRYQTISPTIVTPKVIPTIFIILAHSNRGKHWLYGSRGWTFLPITHKFLIALLKIAAEQKLGKIAPDIKIHMKQRYITEFLSAEKNLSNVIHQH